MGDRQALIEQAVALISEAYPQSRIRISDFIESEPWGYESTHPFLNLGLAIDDFSDEPLSLLRAMQAIERKIADAPHRNPDGSYRDRPIDIDIIEIDGVEMKTPELTLPHPRAYERNFVVIPLSQLKIDN